MTPDRALRLLRPSERDLFIEALAESGYAIVSIEDVARWHFAHPHTYRDHPDAEAGFQHMRDYYMDKARETLARIYPEAGS